MAEAGFNINYIAVPFDIHKTIAYRINNHPGKRVIVILVVVVNLVREIDQKKQGGYDVIVTSISNCFYSSL